jgi:hypothetical protein
VGLGPCSNIAAGYGHTIAIECVGRIGAPTSPELAPFSFETPRSWIANNIETTSTGATITIKARGVLGSKAEFLSVRIDGVALATDLFGSESGTTSCATAISVTTVTIPPALFLNLTTDGQLEIRIEPSSNATSDGCATATLMVQLNYTRDVVDCDANGLDDECDISVAPANRDCNQNLLLDSCEIAAGAADIDMNGRLDSCEVDCNGNGLPDSYEIANNLAPDCNSNALPDSCDVGVDGESNDIDDNGIPDECKSDCNNNTLPDAWEISNGFVQDCNTNAIPDSCDIAVNITLDCNHNGVLDICEGGPSGTDCDQVGTLDTCAIITKPALDCDNSGTIDTCDIAAGIAIDCNLNGHPDSCDITDGAEDFNANGKLDSCELLYGDLNLDERIDGADLGAMLALWEFPNPPYGDLDGDQFITGADLGIMLAHWGVIH